MSSRNAWGQMMSRCYDPEHPKYPRYGARGIRVCDRWICCRLFLQDVGVRPSGKTLNRINNDGNYEPSNCEWATSVEQNGNKHNNRNITFNGETNNLSAWARKIGSTREALRNRLSNGWSVEDALTMPFRVMK